MKGYTPEGLSQNGQQYSLFIFSTSIYNIYCVESYPLHEIRNRNTLVGSGCLHYCVSLASIPLSLININKCGSNFSLV